MSNSRYQYVDEEKEKPKADASRYEYVDEGKSASPNESNLLEKIHQHIVKGLYDTPGQRDIEDLGGAIKNIAGSVAEGIPGLAQQGVRVPLRAIKNAAIGLVNIIPGAANAILNIPQYFTQLVSNAIAD